MILGCFQEKNRLALITGVCYINYRQGVGRSVVNENRKGCRRT